MKRTLDDTSPARLKRARARAADLPPPTIKPIMDAWVPGLGPAFYAAPAPEPEVMPAYAGLDPSFNASYPADSILHHLRHDSYPHSHSHAHGPAKPEPERPLELDFDLDLGLEQPGSARSACTSFTLATPSERGEYFGADTRLAMALADVELDEVCEGQRADDDEMMLDTPHAPPLSVFDPTHALAPSSSLAAPTPTPPPPPPSPVRARAHTAPSVSSIPSMPSMLQPQLHPLSHLPSIHSVNSAYALAAPALTPPLQPRPQRPAVTPLQPPRV